MNTDTKIWRKLLFPGLLGLLVTAAYVVGLQNELIFDDGRLADGTVRDGYGSLLQLKARLLSYGSFNWLAVLVGENWAVQRGVNILLHLGTCAAIYQLFSLLMGRIAYSEDALSTNDFTASRLAALRVGVVFFALNPVAVYAVGYLIQRSIVMATLFAVLACWAFVKGVTEKKAAWFAWTLVLYVAAVLSKEHAFLIAGLGLPLYVFLERPTWKRAAGMFLLSLVLLAAVLAVLLSLYPNLLGQVFDETSRQLTAMLDRQQAGVAEQIFVLSVLNQAGLFFYYGLLWAVPYVGWMSIDLRTPFPLTLTALPHLLGALGYLVVLAGATAAVIRRSDVWGFGGLCLLFPLILFWTEFSTVWVQDPMVLYRSYLWAIPVPALIAVLLTGFSPGTLYKSAVLLGVVLAGLTAERVWSMKSELTVWSDAVAKIDTKAPANVVGRYRAFLNRGAYHLGRFSPELALEDFRYAAALGEPTGGAWVNMAVAQQLLKQHTDALDSLAKAQAMGYKDGALYFQRGESQYALRQFAAAFDSYSTSIATPQDASVMTQSRLRRAEAAMQLQRYAAAAADFEVLAAAEPSNAKYLSGLGMSMVGAGNGAGALSAFSQLLALKPVALGYYGRALAQASLGKADAAREDLARAVQLEPGNAAYKQLQERWKSGVTLSLK
jgi:tetratricopeptide (TPR) repeat protein